MATVTECSPELDLAHPSLPTAVCWRLPTIHLKFSAYSSDRLRVTASYSVDTSNLSRDPARELLQSFAHSRLSHRNARFPRFFDAHQCKRSTRQSGIFHEVDHPWLDTCWGLGCARSRA